jgi:hypothetical protein
VSPKALLTWLVVGVIGWAGVVWLGVQLYATSPPSAGFDLELLLEGGRRVAAGLSPYDAAMLGGTPPEAQSLFYSYPPPVAQAMAVFASVPSSVMLLAWDGAAIAGLLLVADRLRRILAPDLSRSSVLIPVVAAAPLVFPFTVGLLFGNLDVFFPLLYGTMLIAVLDVARTTRIAGGMALAVAALKLHPASLGLWFLIRGLSQHRDGSRPTAWLVVAAALATGALIIVASLAAGGVGPWVDYLAVVRAGTGADIVDPRNVGPAAQIALVLGGGDGMARQLQVPITLAALILTCWFAWRGLDPVTSFGWAAVASLVTLPVTWYHYPSLLIPLTLAAVLNTRDASARSSNLRLAAVAVVVGIAALLWLPALWVGVAIVITMVSSRDNKLRGVVA